MRQPPRIGRARTKLEVVLKKTELLTEVKLAP